MAVAMVLSALGTALLTYALVDKGPTELPTPPRVEDLAESIARQMLASSEAELSRREGLIVHDEERLLDGMETLVKGYEDLARQEERSLKRARKLETVLKGFARQAEEISRRGPSATVRDGAVALEAEARGYLTALGEMIELLEVDRGAALERAQQLRDRLDHRLLRGRSVRVIYEPARREDATRVRDLLSSLEVDAQLFEAEIADPTIHKGRLFYSADEEAVAAAQIARLVDTFEVVEAEKIGVVSPYMSLWIVGEAPAMPRRQSPPPPPG